MGQLIEMNGTQTMSSIEIAELTGKRHDNVMRDARKMLSDLGVLKNEETAINPQNGQRYPVILLDKEESLCLVTGYSAKLRMAVIKRWQELEEAPRLLSPIEQIKSLQAAGLVTAGEAEIMVLRSAGMRSLPTPRKPRRSLAVKVKTKVVSHGKTFEEAVAEFVNTLSGTGCMSTEDAYLMFCEMYGTNMASRNKFVSAVRSSGVEKQSIRFDRVSKQGFKFFH